MQPGQIPKGLGPSTFESTGRCSGDVKDCIQGLAKTRKITPPFTPPKTCRKRPLQAGWSGERAPGFEKRMGNDVLTLGPNVATTCHGMNDGGYSPMTARGLCKKLAHFGVPAMTRRISTQF